MWIFRSSYEDSWKCENPKSRIFYSCWLFARWMCRDCEMNQIISCNTKSNQIWLSLIVHSYEASCAVLNSYTSQPFSITVNFDATEKDNERRGKRGWKSERSRLFCIEIPSNVVSTRFQYPLSIKKQFYGLPGDDVVMQHSFLLPFHRSNCFLLFLDEIESYNNGVIRFAQNVCVAGIEIFNSSRFFPGRRRRWEREDISIESAFGTRNKKSGVEWNSFDELKCERELKS